MKAHPKDAYVNVIIADLHKGERNINPTVNNYSIKCPSFGLSNCTKTFCVAKKWWYIRPLNSDGTSNELSVYWASHFRGRISHHFLATQKVFVQFDNPKEGHLME